MTKPIVNLDSPIYETIYNVITVQGKVIREFSDREDAQAYATHCGLRMVKTVRVVEES